MSGLSGKETCWWVRKFDHILISVREVFQRLC
jgi:hypothetical protein